MLNQVWELVTANPGVALTGVLVVVVLSWAAAAVEEAEDKREALSGFGGRAKEGTGGLLNLVLVGFLAVAGWAATTFATAGEAVAYVASVAPETPVLSAAVATTIFGTVGLSGAVGLSATVFFVVSLSLILLAVAYKRGFGSGGLL